MELVVVVVVVELSAVVAGTHSLQCDYFFLVKSRVLQLISSLTE
jgi:hypothetical protein